MSTVSVDNAVSITPPATIHPRASSASTVQVEFPAAWNKGWVTLAAENQKFWFRFVIDASGAATTETLDETSVSPVSGSGNLLTADVDAAYVLESGTEKHYDLSKLKVSGGQAIKLLHKSPATGGFIRITPSSGPKG